MYKEADISIRSHEEITCALKVFPQSVLSKYLWYSECV